jgi:hypothetical protein
MSFKPRIKTFGDDKFYENNLAFATKNEAELSAKDTYSKWQLAEAWDVIESDQPVNYEIKDGVMRSVVNDKAEFAERVA